ncbi:hypothetical protein Q5P01_012652 [Channa striata]|uniref:Uncharacterized protein n=1 Tax=Channa striata TaxID=64152 RepID=A0AA88SLU3_CHASR|nr:hypothetical protein Q5P01_012652 [Channa striata]
MCSVSFSVSSSRGNSVVSGWRRNRGGFTQGAFANLVQVESAEHGSSQAFASVTQDGTNRVLHPATA